MAEQLQQQGKSIGLTQVGQFLGLLAGLTTLVYVGGGAVLAMRLDAKHFAPGSVVSNLPREFLISIGLTEVVLPLLIAAAILTAVVFVLVRFTNVEYAAGALGDWQHASHRQRVGLVIGILVLTVGGAVAAGLIFDHHVLAVLFALVTSTLFFIGGAFQRQHYGPQIGSFAAVAWTGVLFSLCFTPWVVAFQQRQKLLKATACSTDGTRIDGFLIGETSDRIYIGEDHKAGPKLKARIDAIPRDPVRLLYIGEEAQCPPPPAKP
jgi:hypothetical protein